MGRSRVWTLAAVVGVVLALAACGDNQKPAEPDRDTDGVGDTEDNCPDVANPDQANRDGDGHGDVCDACPDDANDGCSNPGAQTITFTSSAPTAAVVGGAAYTVTATATSGLPVAFTIDPSAAAVCALTDSTVSFLSVGTCVINANQAGNATFQPAPQVQQTFAVGKGAQTIAFTSTAPANAARGGATYTVAATATSGLTVTFTIDASAAGVCSIAGATVSFEGVGTCVINANQAGDANYDAAAQVQQSFSVDRTAQTIAFTSTAPTTAEVAGATYEVSATATSGLPVTFSIDASAASVCTIAGATVSFIGAGTCVIDANQAGDADFGAAPVAQQSFSVGKGAQTISFTSTPPATAVFGGATYTVTATATSGLPVTFTINPLASGVCSIAGSTVSFIGAGTCVIDADQGGDANYNAAPQVQQSFAVGRSAQTIAFTSASPTAAAVEGASYTASATATSGLAVTLTIAPSAAGVCSIAGSTVSFLGVGTCVIEANQVGNANYEPAPQVQQTFTVGKGAQAISFTSTPPSAAVLGGATYTVSATSTASLPVTFTIDPLASGVCTIAGSTVSFTGVGTCVINANQAGNATYNAAPQVQQSFAVGKGAQTITFTSIAPSATVGGPTYTVTATSTSGLPVTFTINPLASGVCTIAGSAVAFSGIGTCIIDANQPGDASYEAAPVAQQTFLVGQGAQAITFTSTAPTTAAVGGATYTVTATANSGLPVSFTIDPLASSVCSLAGATVSFIGVGTCVINANQAGDANHTPALQVQQSFAVGKSAQTISFVSPAPSSPAVGGPTYTVLAMATSALPVTLTIDASAASVCTLAGSTVSFIGAGTCVINANQAGNATYNAAPQVQQSFAVGKGAQSITFTSTAPANATVGGATYTVTATATTGLPVTFTIDPAASGVCSIAGTTVSFTASGTCVINANQAGNANYSAAPQVQQSFAVIGAAQTITFTSTAPASATVGGATYTVTATATSGLAVTFTIDPVASGVCAIAGSTVTFISSGTCVIDANQAGNSTYAPAPQMQQSFAVAKGTQTISFTSTAPTNAVYEGTTYTVTATATSGLPVTVSIDPSSASACWVVGTTVSFVGTGSCAIHANQVGNAAYNPAPQVQQTVLVGPRLVADSYSVVGNTQLVAANFANPATPFTTTATGILANDAADVAITLTTVTNAATTGGGTITIGGTGSFIYTPPPGATGTDTYVYTGTANGVARTGTITFTITNKVWYVNSASTGAHDGRSSSPFLGFGAGANNLGTLAAAGDYIYVHKGGATTSGAHTLLSNQKLIGAGATLSVGALIIPGSSANIPVLSGTLSANNVSGVIVDGVRMSTGTSIAVNLTNTDGTFTFSRIDAGGAPNGIIWNNATAALPTSSFTVTGDGTNTQQGGNSTGGVLSSMTGADGAIAGNAIYLNNVGNVVLRRMAINGTHQNHAIRGFRVNNFTLEYSTLTGTFGTEASLPAPETAGEGTIYFGNTSTTGLTTAGTFTRNRISGGRARNVSIINTSAGTTTLTFKGNSFEHNQNFVDAGHSLAVEARGAGTIINTVIGGTGSANTFIGAPGDQINITGQTGTTMDVLMQANTLSNSHAQNGVGGGGVTLATQGSMTFVVDGNSLQGADGDAISLQKASSGALLSGRVTNNTIGISGLGGSASKSASGIMLAAAGTGTVALSILNNQIRNWAYAGINLDNTGGSYAANFTIQGNTIAEPGASAFAALVITNGAPSSSDTINVCAAVGGSSGVKNTFAAGSGSADVWVVSSGAATGHTFNLPGYVGSTLTNVETFLSVNNTASGGAGYGAIADAPATAAAFTGVGTTCPTP